MFYSDGTANTAVDFSDRSESNFQYAKILKKDTMHTMFPEFIFIPFFEYVLTYKFQQSKYIFLIDRSKYLDQLNKEILEAENSIQAEREKMNKIGDEIKRRLRVELNEALELFEGKIRYHDMEIESLKRDLEYSLGIQKNVETQKEKEIREFRGKSDNALDKAIQKARRDHSGYYYFEWKHERKSWQDASAKIYFDLGNGEMFEKVSDSLLKKVKVSNFIKQFS